MYALNVTSIQGKFVHFSRIPIDTYCQEISVLLPRICQHNKLLHPVFPEKNELNNSIAAHPMRSFDATIVRLDISKSFSCHTPHFHELNAPLDDWNTKPRPPAMKWLKKLLLLFFAIGGERRVIAGWGSTSGKGSLHISLLSSCPTWARKLYYTVNKTVYAISCPFLYKCSVTVAVADGTWRSAGV